ncbi:hypothetical protein ACFLXQ_08960 [Chloroflexota bacterium]
MNGQNRSPMGFAIARIKIRCKKVNKMKIFLQVGILVVSAVVCCNFPISRSDTYHLNDPVLSPFSAMYEVNREQFCLTDIDKNARAEIETDNYATSGYHVMLHIYSNNVSRTVAFVREGSRYIWIGEQEIHYSGHKFMTPDGEIKEHITITYQKQQLDDNVLGLKITYVGDYQNVEFPFSAFDLTCEQVLPYIKEWDKAGKTVTD